MQTVSADKYLNQEGIKPFHDPQEFWAWAQKRAGLSIIREYQYLLEQRTIGKASSGQQFYDFISSHNLACIAASFEYDLLKNILKWVEPRLPDKGTILELGCHSGLMARFYATVRSDVKVIGVDLSTKAIQTANEIARQRKIKNIEFLQYDILNPMLPTLPQVDCIISGRVLGELMSTEFRYQTNWDPVAFPLIDESLDNQTKKALDFCRKHLMPSGNLLFTERLSNFDRLNRMWVIVQKAGFTAEIKNLQPIIWVDVAGKHKTWFFEAQLSNGECPVIQELKMEEIPIHLKSAEIVDDETRLMFNGTLAYETWKKLIPRDRLLKINLEWTQGGKESIEMGMDSSELGHVFIANNMGNYLLTLFLKPELEKVKQDLDEYIHQLVKNGARIINT